MVSDQEFSELQRTCFKNFLIFRGIDVTIQPGETAFMALKRLIKAKFDLKVTRNDIGRDPTSLFNNVNNLIYPASFWNTWKWLIRSLFLTILDWKLLNNFLDLFYCIRDLVCTKLKYTRYGVYEIEVYNIWCVRNWFYRNWSVYGIESVRDVPPPSCTWQWTGLKVPYGLRDPKERGPAIRLAEGGGLASHAHGDELGFGVL